MDRNSRRINMRSADPAAYDQFAELTSGVEFAYPFRALMISATTAVATSASAVITQITNGAAVTKTIVFQSGVGTPTFILPVSGEKVTVTFSSSGTSKCYALI